MSDWKVHSQCSVNCELFPPSPLGDCVRFMKAPRDASAAASAAWQDYSTRQFVRRQQDTSFGWKRKRSFKGVSRGGALLRITCPFCLHGALRGFRFVLLRFDSIFCFLFLFVVVLCLACACHMHTHPFCPHTAHRHSHTRHQLTYTHIHTHKLDSVAATDQVSHTICFCSRIRIRIIILFLILIPLCSVLWVLLGLLSPSPSTPPAPSLLGLV